MLITLKKCYLYSDLDGAFLQVSSVMMPASFPPQLEKSPRPNPPQALSNSYEMGS